MEQLRENANLTLMTVVEKTTEDYVDKVGLTMIILNCLLPTT